MSAFEKISFNSTIVFGVIVIMSDILWFIMFLFGGKHERTTLTRDFVFVILCISAVAMYFSYIVYLLLM